jgi:hypothetical protein
MVFQKLGQHPELLTSVGGVYIDTADRSLTFVTGEGGTLRVVPGFSLETGTMMAFNAI